MKSRSEMARERNARLGDMSLTLVNHLSVVRTFAPDYIIDLDPIFLESFQAVIDGGGFYIALGNRYTAAVLALIASGDLHRAKRSWSGRPLGILNLGV